MKTNTHPTPALPLSRHPLFGTTDLDEARELVGRIFCPHRLETIGRGRFNLRHNHVRGDRISLNYLEYGAKTMIAPGQLESFYLLQIPLEGGAAISNGTDRYYSHTKRAALLNPHRETTMIWEQGCRQILVQIERSAMQDYLVRHLGLDPETPVDFRGGIDLESAPGARLCRLVTHLVTEAETATQPRSTLMGRHFESAILGGIADSFHHSLPGGLPAAPGTIMPAMVRRAEAFMRANLDQPLRLRDIAQAAGISERSLYNGFHRSYDTGPMRFLYQLRLQQIHADLLKGLPGETVTEIAHRWGITHLGRLSQNYHDQFGCQPSKTLRSARETGFLN